LRDEEVVLECPQEAKDETIEVVPAAVFEVVNDQVHLFEGHYLAHEGEQPAVEEAVDVHSQPHHMQVQTALLLLEQAVDAAAPQPQLLQVAQVDHPQLLLLHQLHQCPKRLLCRLYVIQQDSSYEVDALDVPQFWVVDAVGKEDLFEHVSEVGVSAEGGVVGVGAVDVLGYLQFVGLGGRQFPQFGVGYFVLGTHLLAPFHPVLAWTVTGAALL